MTNSRKLVEGAIFSSIFLILCFAYRYTVVISGFIFIALPMVVAVYANRSDFKYSMIFVFVNTVLAFLFVGIQDLPLVMSTISAGLIIVLVLKKKLNMRILLVLQTINFSLFTFLMIYFYEFFYGISLTTEINAMGQYFIEMPKFVLNLFPTQYVETFKMMADMENVSFWLILSTSIFTGIIYAFGISMFMKLVFTRLKVDISNLEQKHFMYYKINKIFIYMFLAIAPFVIFKVQLPPQAYIAINLINILVSVLLFFNGLAVLVYYFAVSKTPGLMRILFIFLAFSVPMLLIMVGIFDSINDLRPLIIEYHRRKSIEQMKNENK
jgi:uncharacterized protein YybS (DUF2232 family)